MTIEEQLKAEILTQYRSVRAFTTAIEIPYSTMDSIFKRGIANAGVGTVIKIFKALGLDVESLGERELKKDRTPTQHKCDEGVLSHDEISRLSNAMGQLNEEGRERVVEYAEDLAAGGRYKKIDTDHMGKKEA